jgi:DNA (cytosine-5)-methyltransferase 1
MRYASVCDGIGAAHVAWQPLGWECAWTSEIETFPAAVVDHHWKIKNLGDMTKLTEEMLNECGSVDLLVGGTPCQSFSVAGLRGGLADPRGNLALRFVQLVGVLRPSWVVWENVPGVLSSGGGRDFGTFLGALAELGYGFAYRVLDAQWFGVAQRRRRVFVVAHLGNWQRAAAVLFERESLLGNPPTRGAKGQGSTSGFAASSFGNFSEHECGCLRAQNNESTLVAFHPTQDPISSTDGSTHAMGCGSKQGCCTQAVAFTAKDSGGDATPDVAPTMRAMGHSVSHANGGGQLAVAFTKSKRAQSTTDDETWVPGEVSPTMSCFDQGDTRATTVVAYDVHGTLATKGASPTDCHTALRSRPPGQSEASTTTVVAFQDVHGTLRSNAGACRQATTGDFDYPPVMNGMAVRRLTPRECERLQGFPDDYTLVTYRNKPAADGPRYRALGNSMAVPVMAWIGQRIQMVKEATDG